MTIRTIDERPVVRMDATRGRTYRVLTFRTRSAAVRYCLQIADALESSRLVGDPRDRGATLWLAAAGDVGGAVNVYACAGAMQAALAAGIEARAGGEVCERELPAARCLVIGDTQLLRA